MRYEATGKIVKIFDTEKKSESFQAREFVIEMPDGNYSQMVKFQLTQDRCDMVNNFSEGDQVKVTFNLRGREWQGKYFTNLDAWRVEAATEGANGQTAAGGAAPFGDVVFPEAHQQSSNFNDEKDDDLPF
jgi:single-strand DNA-binding protein